MSEHNPEDRLNEIELQLGGAVNRTDEPIFHGDQYVEIEHVDGSYLLFRSAVLVDEDTYVYVFTERCGRHWFNVDDIAYYSQFTKGPNHKLPFDIT